jgi:hypothetical protein
MCPLELSLAAKVRQKLITKEAAEAAANRPTVLRDYLASPNFSYAIPGLALAESGDLDMEDDELMDLPPARQLTTA